MLSILLCFILWSSCVCDIPPSCVNPENTLPIIRTVPQLVKSVENGMLFQVPIDDLSPPLSIAHVFGSAYDMGYARGALFNDSLTMFFAETEIWVESQAEQFLDFFPAYFRKYVEEFGVWAALEFEVLATGPYTPQRFLDEIRGISDATGLDYHLVWRFELLPSLIQAACSIVGAWGSAVPSSQTFVQLRALDWSVTGPFQKWPVLLVHHPLDGDGGTYATLGWSGFMGGLTGYSQARVGLSQKVDLEYPGYKPRMGIPFHFLLRDILQYDSSLAEANSRIINADRTCSVWLGLSDASQEMEIVQYSYENLTFYDHETFPAWAAHPTLPDVMYINKHVQPSSQPCLGDILTDLHGSLDPQAFIQYVCAFEQTGDTHIAVMSQAENALYVANASPYLNGKAIPAYSRPFVFINMTEQFAVTPKSYIFN